MDEIVVTGVARQPDRAMAAFEAGDFVTAEIEFGANLRCAERVETLAAFAKEELRAGALASETAAAAGSSTATVVPPDVRPVRSTTTATRSAALRGRTCEDKPFQLYMMALSQLKLGKNAEAKATLQRVVRLAKGNAAYDAHYRLGLLHLLDGELDEAERRLKNLQVYERRCARQGERCAMRTEIDEAVTVLAGGIEAARKAS